MDVLVLIGRILFVGIFVTSGIAHLTKTDMLTGYAKSRGVPAAQAAVLLGGLLLLLGALSVLLGVWADLGALLLLIFLVPTAVLMHGFWKETDPQAKLTEQTQFFKDLGLAGASLMLLAFFAHVEDLGLTLTGPLFDV